MLRHGVENTLELEANPTRGIGGARHAPPRPSQVGPTKLRRAKCQDGPRADPTKRREARRSAGGEEGLDRRLVSNAQPLPSLICMQNNICRLQHILILVQHTQMLMYFYIILVARL